MLTTETSMTIETKDGPDKALAAVLAAALEKTYGVLAEGQAAEFSRHLEEGFGTHAPAVDTPKLANENLPEYKVLAQEAGDAMKHAVTPAPFAEPSKVAQVAELQMPAQEKGRGV